MDFCEDELSRFVLEIFLLDCLQVKRREKAGTNDSSQIDNGFFGQALHSIRVFSH